MTTQEPPRPARTTGLQATATGLEATATPTSIRVRWIGHELHAEAEVVSDAGMSLREAHDIAEDASHRLLHDVRRLTAATIHSSPSVIDGHDPHAVTAHHVTRAPAAE